MTSFIFFVAGVLASALVFVLAGQKKNRSLSDRMSSLASEMAAKQREAELLAACDTLPEARYNLGLLKAATKDFAGAYELLRPFGDLNAAVTAVCLGKFVEADAILDALQDMSPEAEYVRAMVAAALMDADAFFTHLEPAVADEALRQRAENDSYFDVYRHDDRFKVIMEGR